MCVGTVLIRHPAGLQQPSSLTTSTTLSPLFLHDSLEIVTCTGMYMILKQYYHNPVSVYMHATMTTQTKLYMVLSCTTILSSMLNVIIGLYPMATHVH